MPTPELQQWEEEDAAFVQAFRDANSLHPKHIFARWMGWEKEPSLNEYRTHLVAGHYVGALPVQGSGYQPNEEFTNRDFDGDVHVHFSSSAVIKTASARRELLRLTMELQAGKISVIADNEESEESDLEGIAA